MLEIHPWGFWCHQLWLEKVLATRRLYVQLDPFASQLTVYQQYSALFTTCYGRIPCDFAGYRITGTVNGRAMSWFAWAPEHRGKSLHEHHCLFWMNMRKISIYHSYPSYKRRLITRTFLYMTCIYVELWLDICLKYIPFFFLICSSIWFIHVCIEWLQLK